MNWMSELKRRSITVLDLSEDDRDSWHLMSDRWVPGAACTSREVAGLAPDEAARLGL